MLKFVDVVDIPFFSSHRKVRLCASMCVYERLCASMCVYVRLCASMCLYVHLCASVCGYVRLCASMCVYLRLCASMCGAFDLYICPSNKTMMSIVCQISIYVIQIAYNGVGFTHQKLCKLRAAVARHNFQMCEKVLSIIYRLILFL